MRWVFTWRWKTKECAFELFKIVQVCQWILIGVIEGSSAPRPPIRLQRFHPEARQGREITQYFWLSSRKRMTTDQVGRDLKCVIFPWNPHKKKESKTPGGKLDSFKWSRGGLPNFFSVILPLLPCLRGTCTMDPKCSSEHDVCGLNNIVACRMISWKRPWHIFSGWDLRVWPRSTAKMPSMFTRGWD